VTWRSWSRFLSPLKRHTFGFTSLLMFEFYDPTHDCGETTPTPTPPGREGQKKGGDGHPGWPLGAPLFPAATRG
jgi:hypothetical protein